MIMVDQLWLCLWTVETEKMDNTPRRYASSAVLTSFPSTSYPRSDKDPIKLYRIADMRQGVLEKLEGKDNKIFRGSEVASSILSTAILGTLTTSKEWSLDFLELFREAIGNVTEKHDDFFRSFDESMTSGAKRIDVNQRRDEVRLVLQNADIIGELHMLEQLFETQRNVLQKGWKDILEVKCLELLQKKMRDLLRQIVDDYLPQIQQMTRDSERVQKSLLELLDLQQKEENLYEAQSANQQALFTAKQALSAQDQADATNEQWQIIFVFTAVTIIFLPLSFFTSYFGMNIDNGNNGSLNYKRSHVNKVMGGASGPTIGLLLIGAGIWYYVVKRRSAHNRTKELSKLQDQKCLPRELVDETDPEHKKMENMGAKLARRGIRHTPGEKSPVTRGATTAVEGMTPAAEGRTPAGEERPSDHERFVRGLEHGDHAV